MNFLPFPKIPRLNRDMVITEKIDGTNAQVYIIDSALIDAPMVGTLRTYPELILGQQILPVGASNSRTLLMLAGSRNKWLSADKKGDNMGFARWVLEHSQELWALGEGQHFGEWWGNGIQRTYGLQNGDKRFSLFAVHRWNEQTPPPACCSVVPVLYQGPFHSAEVHAQLYNLCKGGSVAAPGFMKPEGIIVYHEAAKQLFKVTCEDDASPKGKA